MIYLMDMGTHFEMSYKTEHVTIEYGEYSLSMANIDFDVLLYIIKDYLDIFTKQFELATTLGQLDPMHTEAFEKYEHYGIYPNAVKQDVVDKLVKALAKPLYRFLDNGYLNESQLEIIVILILRELKANIMSETFNWKNESTYIPSLLIYKELHLQLESILLHDSTHFSTELQNFLSHKVISSTIDIDKNGTARTVFHIKDTISFLILDLQKYLTGTKTVLRCQNPNCQRLFYPKSKKNKLYCQLKHKDSELTCNEIMHRTPVDEFAKLIKQAKGAQEGFVKNAQQLETSDKYDYDYEKLESIYNQWLLDIPQKMQYYRSINDFDGFKQWVEDNKLNVKRLEKLKIRIPKKTNTSKAKNKTSIKKNTVSSDIS